ncbi:MAG TPA: NAD(P)-dependent oxidoreductase [Actinomycetota bacterium]|nr:NAD(P)-dependent oxidoreductase [Actinomycetota bacterium]
MRETRTVLTHLGRFHDEMIPLLERLVPGVTFTNQGTSDVLVALPTDHAALAAKLTPGVRWVHVLGAGVDGFPLDAVGDRLLTSSRGAAAPAIAEFVLAGMLAFEKQLPERWLHEPPERWNTARLGSLRGKTVGILGLGAIGTEVARLSSALGADVVAVRRTRQTSSLPGVEISARWADVLARADHLVVTLPATKETYHLLGKAAFADMKPGVVLTNISRGTIVDQDALLAALDDGTVARANLDVVDPEPLPSGHPLYSHPNVRLTAHISWSSPDTMRRTIAQFADNLRRYENGEPLHDLVDLDAGY